MLPVLPLLEHSSFPAIVRGQVRTLQVNLGYRCNQSCQHCHVNAGPNRTEEMNGLTVDQVIAFLAANPSITSLDLTGGAPELNPHFRRLVSAVKDLGRHVIDRCNLTILSEPGYEWLPEFLADHGVEVVASLPCYLEDNVDRQRGRGSFSASIEGLRTLNRFGYAAPSSDLALSLVYNPQGAVLPPPQARLEAEYRLHLRDRYGIEFTRLVALANMPIQRFGSMLISKREFASYMQTLKSAHRPSNLSGVMCKELLSVDWQGYLYDCDFNQQLGLPLGGRSNRLHLLEVTASLLAGKPICVADHCYACTAGQGSSCLGALGESDGDEIKEVA
jgi:radical SAM/Cys-rich protein